MFSCLLLILFAVACCGRISSPIPLRLCSQLLAQALPICYELEKGLDCVLVNRWSRTYSANAVLVYKQSICWARDLLGIRRHGKHNKNDAFVTIVRPWTHSVTFVYWLQTINLMRAGLDIGEHGKEHTEPKSWLRNFCYLINSLCKCCCPLVSTADNQSEQWEWAAGSFAMNWSTDSSNRDSCKYE